MLDDIIVAFKDGTVEFKDDELFWEIFGDTFVLFYLWFIILTLLQGGITAI